MHFYVTQFYFFVCMCVCVPTYLYVCLHADACRGQSLESCPLEKDLQVIVRCLSWVLGMAPSSL